MDSDTDFERTINNAMDALENAIENGFDEDFKERYDRKFLIIKFSFPTTYRNTLVR